MKTSVLAALVATASAAKTKGTFGVLRFAGDGPLMDCRIDPIVQPGGPSAHVHTFMGGNNIGWNTTGEDLRQSSCTNALPKADKSGYWFPKLYFKDPVDGKLEPVPMYYSAVYYFFEKSKDDIKAFPVGLKMVSGKATIRTPPVKGNILNLNPGDGPVSATGITCPRGNFNPPSWPSGSDGSSAGIGDPQNLGKGIGFPVQNCDGQYSPMRVDVHMPSCYNPAAGLENYQNNMAWPTKSLDDSWNCPSGHIHVPHLFFETYWNTQLFADRFKSLNGKESPWVFANGDVTGFSAHADFIAAWDEKALQHIIDTCNVEHGSLSECPGLIGGVNSASSSCKATCPVQETVTGKLDKLPGNNPLSGFKYGGGSSSPSVMEPAPADVPAALPAPAASSAPVVGSGPVEAEPYPLDAKAVPVATTLVPAIKVLAKEPEATPAPEVPEPAFAPAAVPAPQPEGKTAVVLETVTVWQTKTVYGSSDPTPVADDTKRRRRHVHDHMMHHRRRS